MNYKFLKYEILEKSAIITLNRPDVLNSINKPFAKEIQDALIKSSKNDEVRSILLTGNGKGFCAGQDLKEATQLKNMPVSELGNIVNESYNPIIKLLRNIEKPIVCAVNGIAAGAGANIAIACDVVVASENASFIQSFSKIGLIPDSGGTYFLPRLIGFGKASALMMLADKLTAKEALDVGLIYKVFPQDKFWEESLKLAAYLAKQPTKAFGLIKKLINKSFENTLEEQLVLEGKMQTIAGKTNDFIEGVKAFQEKRKPNFNGD